MQKPIVDRLELFLQEAERIFTGEQMRRWSKTVESFLETAVTQSAAREFSRLTTSDTQETFALQRGHIEGLAARAAAQTMAVQPLTPNASVEVAPLQRPVFESDSKKVFIVHGHDNEVKERTARFLENIGLQPIILHEQPSSGRTIIEKFETYSGDIVFAVVLLTPDDIGGVANKPDACGPRARQNVILELGYFIGRLGRSRVCALHNSPLTKSGFGNSSA
jgi:predicted nucleotide-binding protein